MKKNSRKIRYVSTLIYIVIILGFFGFFAYFTSGFTDDFKSFYVKINDETVLTDKTINFTNNKETRIDCKYLFATPQTENKGYGIKIMPNNVKDLDFEFKVDGINYRFSKIEDLTNAFDLKKNETYFTLRMQGEKMIDLLKRVYPSQVLTEVPDVYISSKPYFKTIITSYNGKAKIEIINNLFIDLIEIKFDKERIIW